MHIIYRRFPHQFLSTPNAIRIIHRKTIDAVFDENKASDLRRMASHIITDFCVCIVTLLIHLNSAS